jgi:hypothetical protein
MFVKYIFWILLFFCSVDAFAKVDWAECSSTEPDKVCYLIAENEPFGRQIREYQPSGEHLRLTGDRTNYLLSWHPDDAEYGGCGSLIQREKHTRYKIDEFCSPKAVGGRRVMMADESDSADVVRLFDALERRKNWLLNLRVGKSNLSICEDSMNRGTWNGCFEQTRSYGEVYTGEFRNGKRYGNGSSVSGGGTFTGKYDGNSADGILDYKNGQVFKGNIFINTGNIERSGKGTFQWENGDTLDGVWKDDYPNGQMTLTQSSGRVTREFIDGVPVFDPNMCLGKTENQIVELLGIPDKSYQAGQVKYLSFAKTFDYNFKNVTDYKYGCTISLDMVFSLVAGKTVSVKKSELSFGKNYKSCTKSFDWGQYFWKHITC